jgi:uncharacterized protein (TIGR03083 family)
VNADPRTWIATLRESHDNLVRIAEPMTAEQVRGQSFCRDWSNAQVLSHLGSGAEIALMGLPGALGEGPPVSRDAFPPVWDRWNAKNPDEQAADALAKDEEHVQRLEQLSDEELAAARMDFMGMQLDATGMIRLRLGEHVLHTWDLAVMQDPAATVQADAVELLIDNVPQFLAPRLGKPLPEPLRVRIVTTDPARDYLLTSAESVRVVNWPGAQAAAANHDAGEEGDGAGDGDGEVPRVDMPAEALLRLAYGRLDPAHTQAAVSGDPEVLDKLRAIFPGF